MGRDRQDLRRRLAVLAATQSGYFTAKQALGVGYSYQAQKYHADRGNWQRVDRGVFRLPEWPVSQHDDLVRWSLWSRGKAVVSHETALVVYDVGDFSPAFVHLTVPPNFRARAPGIRLHRAELPAEDIRRQERNTQLCSRRSSRKVMHRIPSALQTSGMLGRAGLFVGRS